MMVVGSLPTSCRTHTFTKSRQNKRSKGEITPLISLELFLSEPIGIIVIYSVIVLGLGLNTENRKYMSIV